jgi:hypothetical protein
MRPPRIQTPGIDLSSVAVIRTIILNATAIVVTFLILRLATLIVSNSDAGAVPGLIQQITSPIVWPFSLIPPFNVDLFAGITIIDLLIIPLIALIGLFVAGVITGWRDSTARQRRHPAFDE